jgi:transcriptional regulator with XRE-family HTH domain
MREGDRAAARRKLDEEMRLFRKAGSRKNPTPELLRNVRMALGIPTTEIAGKLGSSHTLVYRLERSEARNTITVKSMDRLARAMGCRVVYGIVPMDGKTLDELAEFRLWKKRWGLISQKTSRSKDARSAEKAGEARMDSEDDFRLRKLG